jgi:hypothetical protein
MVKKPAKDDEAAEWAGRAAENEQNIIRLLRSHQLSDPSALPNRAEFLGGAKREAEGMTHAQLVNQYLNTLAALHHTLGMMMHADSQRVANGIMYGERVTKATGFITDLTDQSRKTKADRKRGGDNKNARDPKQIAKAEAFKLWEDWQAGRARHKSGAAFARHVVDKLPLIESTKTVERWVTQWRKDAKAMK